MTALARGSPVTEEQEQQEQPTDSSDSPLCSPFNQAGEKSALAWKLTAAVLTEGTSVNNIQEENRTSSGSIP